MPVFDGMGRTDIQTVKGDLWYYYCLSQSEVNGFAFGEPEGTVKERAFKQFEERVTNALGNFELRNIKPHLREYFDYFNGKYQEMTDAREQGKKKAEETKAEPKEKKQTKAEVKQEQAKVETKSKSAEIVNYDKPFESVHEIKDFLESIGYKGEISKTFTDKDGNKLVRYNVMDGELQNIYIGKTTPKDLLMENANKEKYEKLSEIEERWNEKIDDYITEHYPHVDGG